MCIRDRAYGLLQGMAMPMLYFPSSFLSSFASLLIPKIAKEFEQGHRRAVAHITEKALGAALQFGIFCAGVFFVFGGDWGTAFYQSCLLYTSWGHPFRHGKNLQLYIDK